MQFAIDAIRRRQSVSLTVEASDLDEARRQAEAQGCTVVGIRAKRSAFRWAWSRTAAFPLMQFNQSLLLLLKAGLSIVEAVETLADRETRADAKHVLLRLQRELGEGLSLSSALERQSHVFPALYIASVRANERTGALVEAIERFNLYRARSEQVRKRVVGASIYPAMILVVGVLVIGFLLFYVVPRFSVVFADMGDRIPWMSRLLLDWGRFISEESGQVLAAVALAIALMGYTLSSATARRALYAGLQRIPAIGQQFKVYQLARFYRALGLLLQAGMPLMQALGMAAGLLPPTLQMQLQAATRAIGEGRSLSSAFEEHGLTTTVSRRLLRVAERSGAMGDMLERTASFHDEDISQAIDWFVRLFEPLLMIVIGMVIGVVVLLMYAPIFELAGSLQ